MILTDAQIVGIKEAIALAPLTPDARAFVFEAIDERALMTGLIRGETDMERIHLALKRQGSIAGAARELGLSLRQVNWRLQREKLGLPVSPLSSGRARVLPRKAAIRKRHASPSE